jgi:tetratricopeptide (TPR) repeat protein
LEIDPNFATAHYNLGTALVDRGQVDEAMAQYRKALEIKPDLAEAHYYLGNVLANRGQVGEAIEHYQTALGLASARNDRALVDVLQARIRRLQPEASRKP